jgi:hypothetical protein
LFCSPFRLWVYLMIRYLCAPFTPMGRMAIR